MAAALAAEVWAAAAAAVGTKRRVEVERQVATELWEVEGRREATELWEVEERREAMEQ